MQAYNPNFQVCEAHLLVHLTDGTTVDVVLAITIFLVIYGSTGTLVLDMQAFTLYILEARLSYNVLSMLFLPV